MLRPTTTKVGEQEAERDDHHRYAGQGEIAKYGFRVANMGTLTPDDMTKVVAAFAESLEELGRA